MAALLDKNRRETARQEKKKRLQDIEAAAVYFFTRLPYHEVNLDGIANKAGVRLGLPVMYFGSKEELFATVLRGAIEDWAAEASKMLTSTGTESSPAAVASVLAGSFSDNPDLCRLLALGPLVLEVGVQMEAADSALRVLHHRIEALGEQVEGLFDSLQEGDGYALIRRLISTVLGNYPFAQPRGALAMALCDERLESLRVDLPKELDEVALAYLSD